MKMYRIICSEFGVVFESEVAHEVARVFEDCVKNSPHREFRVEVA